MRPGKVLILPKRPEHIEHRQKLRSKTEGTSANKVTAINFWTVRFNLIKGSLVTTKSGCSSLFFSETIAISDKVFVTSFVTLFRKGRH